MSTIRPSLSREDRAGRTVYGPPGRPSPGALIDTIQALTEEAREAERQGDRTAARDSYERALRTLSPGVPGACARASSLLRWIARTYDADGDAEAALDCLEASLAIAEAAGDEGSTGHALNVKSTVRWRQGDSDDAQRCLLRAHGYALAAGDVMLAAMTAQNLGVLASLRGDADAALRHYEQSLARYRTLGLDGESSIVLNNLGLLHASRADWSSAEAAYEAAASGAVVSGDHRTQAAIAVNAAAMWVSRGDLSRAEQLVDAAAAAADQANDASTAAESCKIRGMIARERGDYSLAESLLLDAEEQASKRQEVRLVAEIERERAELCRLRGDNSGRLLWLNRSYARFHQLRASNDVSDIDQRLNALEREFTEAAHRWGESIEASDHYTQGHCIRVAELSSLIAAEAGYNRRDLFWIKVGALLHDVGKIVVPAPLLNKRGRLSEEEWALVRSHTVEGVRILRDAGFPDEVLAIVRSHHERWNGSGYPDGLVGDEIPLCARILCIADIYDALATDRSYKKALTRREALALMRHEVGHAFDATVFEHFETVMRRTQHDAAAAASEISSEPPSILQTGRRISEGSPAAALDDLTGLPLRGAFTEAAGQVLDARRTSGRKVSLLVVDIDHFKIVNDSFGHMQGDDVLLAVAQELQEHTRGGDFVGRFAGDEFVVLLPGTDAEGACAFAERLRKGVAGLKCRRREGRGEPISITLSIGVATAPTNGETYEELFATADAALYNAKRRGRNAVAPAASSSHGLDTQLMLDGFVGRREERERLTRLIEKSDGGRPHIVMVAGEAGIGKSTLLRQLEPDVRVRGGSLIRTQHVEGATARPYAAWIEALSAIHSRGLVPARRWCEFPRLLPLLGDGLASVAEDESVVFLEELAKYLRLASEPAPLVLILEDMHWADAGTWRALEHLATSLDDSSGLLVCLTLRGDELRGNARERRRRLASCEQYTEIEMRRLSRAELEQWVDSTFGRYSPPERLVEHLYIEGEGNPFITSELFRTMRESDELRFTGDEWIFVPASDRRLPTAVSVLLTRLLDRLSPESRTVIEAAAVLGRDFDADVLDAALDGGEEAVLEALDQALATGVLARAAGPGARFSFSYALLVDVVLQSANPLRIRRYHERVARALQVRSPEAVALIARHYDDGGCPEPAYRFSMLAGQRAVAAHALEEARTHFETAHRQASTEHQLAKSRWELAKVAEMAGSYDEAQEGCDLILSTYAAGAAEAGLFLPARILRERLRMLRGGPPSRTLEAGHELLAEAQQSGSAADAVAIRIMISQAHSKLGDQAAAERVSREMVTHAETCSDDRALADALMRLGTVTLHRPNEAVSLYRRASELYVKIGDRAAQLRASVNLGVAHNIGENLPAAEAAYCAAHVLGREMRTPDLTAVASLNLGVLHIKTGRWNPARERLDEALRLSQASSNQQHRLASLYNLAHLARERGDAAACVELYEAVISLARAMGQRDVHAGALSGVGLAMLQLRSIAAAQAQLAAATELVAERSEWWFQGRELFEALRIRLALTKSRSTDAIEVSGALLFVEKHDGYGAAWLAAECAEALANGRGTCTADLARFAERASALGYAPLLNRFAAAGLVP